MLQFGDISVTPCCRRRSLKHQTLGSFDLQHGQSSGLEDLDGHPVCAHARGSGIEAVMHLAVSKNDIKINLDAIGWVEPKVEYGAGERNQYGPQNCTLHVPKADEVC